jgi:isopenicillin N synthase-like dioxygenase
LSSSSLPLIDIAPLRDGKSEAPSRQLVARAIAGACRDTGFFYVTGHGVPPELLARLDAASRRFFALPEEAKAEIAMAQGGRAWRGWFPVGGELTSGRPDLKEGLYLGTELAADHPRVRAGWPLHGANLWPRQVAELREAALSYMAATERAAEALLTGIALSLELEEDYFARHYTAQPTVLFRIFRYPAEASSSDAAARPSSGAAEAPSWGVGEHTDYGLLTLPAQDENGGLQVKTPAGWIEAPPLAGTLVCNIGDMLERMTGGFYRSTPHRVRNAGTRDRLSFPLFFDPDFTARIRPIPGHEVPDAQSMSEDRVRRWDGESVHLFDGTYGDYLMAKVSKVFPALRHAAGLGPIPLT